MLFRSKSGWGGQLDKGQAQGVAIGNWGMAANPKGGPTPYSGTSVAAVVLAEVGRRGDIFIPRVDMVIFDGVARLEHGHALEPWDMGQNLALDVLRQRGRDPIWIYRMVVKTFRLKENLVTLAVGETLKKLLEERGATVVMTRTTRAAVALAARPGIARRAEGDAFVSIHLNAWPDGANPERAANGTGTYFFHDQSEGLARVVQQGLVRRMGLRDLGINFDNLAVARLTWMPAVLCEGAFVIVPQQEAALRTPEFQRQYALGIADGVEEYFRRLRDER